jgi:hypothetical protein
VSKSCTRLIISCFHDAYSDESAAGLVELSADTWYTALSTRSIAPLDRARKSRVASDTGTYPGIGSLT